MAGTTKLVRCLFVCACVQADLEYNEELQSTRLHEILNTSVEVETGLEVQGHHTMLLY